MRLALANRPAMRLGRERLTRSHVQLVPVSTPRMMSMGAICSVARLAVVRSAIHAAASVNREDDEQEADARGDDDRQRRSGGPNAGARRRSQSTISAVPEQVPVADKEIGTHQLAPRRREVEPQPVAEHVSSVAREHVRASTPAAAARPSGRSPRRGSSVTTTAGQSVSAHINPGILDQRTRAGEAQRDDAVARVATQAQRYVASAARVYTTPWGRSA